MEKEGRNSAREILRKKFSGYVCFIIIARHHAQLYVYNSCCVLCREKSLRGSFSFSIIYVSAESSSEVATCRSFYYRIHHPQQEQQHTTQLCEIECLKIHK